MSDIAAIIRKAVEWSGQPLALATVLSTWGSAPRPRGSHMLVHQDGRFEGSVSGGCVEGDVLETAAHVIRTQMPVRRRYGVANLNAWAVGLPCGGEIEILVQPVGEQGFPPALFTAINAAQAGGEVLELATDMETGITTLGKSGAFVNRYTPPRRLLICGAVQIAQSLSAIAQELGIHTTVIDPRERFLTAERFPHAILDDRWPDEAIAALRPDTATAIVTLSHDIKIDDPALMAAIATPAAYIGALGSRKSHAARIARLQALGARDDELRRIDGPAGIDIGSIGASEIALSIASAMIAAFQGKTP